MNSTFYPDVFRGCEVEWANDPQAPESRWRLAKVTVLKTDSCDMTVYGEFGEETHNDCIYLDDPRCYKTKDWAQSGRGIFRLSQGELRRRALDSRITRIEQRLVEIERRRYQEMDVKADEQGPMTRSKRNALPA